MKFEDFRQTGRTTRMLKDVVEKLTNDSTKNALIIVDVPDMVSAAVKILDDIKPPEELNGKIKIDWIGNHKTNLDWTDLTIAGQSPNTLIYFDHYVFEKTFGNILDKAVEFIEVTKP